MNTISTVPSSRQLIKSHSETLLNPRLSASLVHPKILCNGDSILMHQAQGRRVSGSKFMLLCKIIFLLSILYTALGHFLDQNGLWDPCVGQVIYKKSYITESYLGGRALRCSLKEDYFCMVPGYAGERTSAGWTFSGSGCDETLVQVES